MSLEASGQSSTDPEEDVTVGFGALEGTVRRLAGLWGGSCVLKVAVPEDGSLLPVASYGVAEGSGAPVTIALCEEGETVGALEMASPNGSAPSPENRAAVSAVAEALVTALQAIRVRQAAERSLRGRDEIMAVLAHDLRSPLNAITGWCHMLQSGALSAEQRENAVEVIARNARLQGQLIGDVADLSRVLGGRMPVAWAAVDAVALTRKVAEASVAARVKKVVVEVPEGLSTPAIWADPDLISQVVRLLLNHSIKLAPSGGRVLVSMAPDASRLEMTFDTPGAGLGRDALATLFGGIGEMRGRGKVAVLGVELARQLILLLQGTLAAESDGPGTPLRVRVAFPLAPAAG